MADLIEYVRWRGDLSFNERSFNDVDNLVLSQIVYHSYEEIVPDPDSRDRVRLRDAVRKNLEHPDIAEFPGLDQSRNDEFLKIAGDTFRFGIVEMSDYVNVVSCEPDGRKTQFCALVYHLPDKSKYIAFRGTDNTIFGWREDFMISYTDTDAQHQALAYTERMLKKYTHPGIRWRMGGHSKGGNLAVYSFVGLEKELQEKICGLYSNDGPGFDPEVFGNIEHKARALLRNHYHKFVTTYDVIGMMFADKEVRQYPENQPWLKIVASSAKGLMQHWMLTWQVLPDRFETRNQIETGARALCDVLDQWIGSATLEEREAFISTLFDTIERNGPNISDALKNTKKTAAEVINEIFRGNHQTRCMFRKLFASMGIKAKQQMKCKLCRIFKGVVLAAGVPARRMKQINT